MVRWTGTARSGRRCIARVTVDLEPHEKVEFQAYVSLPSAIRGPPTCMFTPFLSISLRPSVQAHRSQLDFAASLRSTPLLCLPFPVWSAVTCCLLASYCCHLRCHRILAELCELLATLDARHLSFSCPHSALPISHRT
ncbi:uncharacterized protein LAESUDRAFT_77371 [Laetiporus sulphureus 93-53]|uniref:Uncharacterized protein n=1 Tax=Laetiporus sulphureus 93-53 TaxID=1314785 RepID=A0A165F0Z5_9APHY|nr:uncharacterized protein LAESUDRAFT_77371 [Laetiporus sulphureus 93-53]KZT08136.1 hypothetical protein LAESUDRAFT_77371 [Laetiporus sulphureus 93-53]